MSKKEYLNEKMLEACKKIIDQNICCDRIFIVLEPDNGIAFGLGVFADDVEEEEEK